VVEIRLFVEGGGQHRQKGRGDMSTKMRDAFRSLFVKLKLSKKPRIVPCGSRNDTYNRFKGEIANGKSLALLLVDSGSAVSPSGSEWQHLLKRDKWEKPKGADNDSAFLMVQCLESWFYADKGALSSYYGAGFKPKCLTQNPHIEEIPKQTIYAELPTATKDTTKGEYSKGGHSFDILGSLDPLKIRTASRRADRFFSRLEAVCE